MLAHYTVPDAFMLSSDETNLLCCQLSSPELNALKEKDCSSVTGKKMLPCYVEDFRRLKCAVQFHTLKLDFCDAEISYDAKE